MVERLVPSKEVGEDGFRTASRIEQPRISSRAQTVKEETFAGCFGTVRRSGERELTRQVDDSTDVQEMVPTKFTGCMHLVGDSVDPIVGTHWFHCGE